jgi:hypothetical protein
MRTKREIATAMQGMTLADMQEREREIKQQAGRKKRLRELTDTFHQGKYGDYAETYDEFEATYFGTVDGKRVTKDDLAELQISRAEWDAGIQPIPRYASCAEDETYGIIYCFDTLIEALNHQGGVPSSGDTLNVPAGIYDLDGKGSVWSNRVSTRNVTLSEKAHLLLCGLVQATEDIDSEHIFAPDELWAELRALFPADEFRQNVEDVSDKEWDEDPPNDIYYDPRGE